MEKYLVSFAELRGQGGQAIYRGFYHVLPVADLPKTTAGDKETIITTIIGQVVPDQFGIIWVVTSYGKSRLTEWIN